MVAVPETVRLAPFKSERLPFWLMTRVVDVALAVEVEIAKRLAVPPEEPARENLANGVEVPIPTPPPVEAITTYPYVPSGPAKPELAPGFIITFPPVESIPPVPPVIFILPAVCAAPPEPERILMFPPSCPEAPDPLIMSILPPFMYP
jgi:hypothetical protein